MRQTIRWALFASDIACHLLALSFLVAASIIARIAARMDSGRSGHLDTINANSGDSWSRTPQNTKLCLRWFVSVSPTVTYVACTTVFKSVAIGERSCPCTSLW